MAMGAAGINVSHKGNGNGHRGRPYGLMLLLAFGIALLGVMALHKLRERRIFNLLVEEKSRQLISLRQLLQKEKEHTKEMKRKAEETKAKIYSLRNQKMELDRGLLEMQSTIDSLKDEQKTMESELEEKQKEIKLLRDKAMEPENENPQVVALTATLKQKEAEIEDLMHRLESPVRVWSVSTDDPSNLPVNVAVTASMEQKEKAEFRHEEGERVHESSGYKGGENSTKVKDGNETTSNFPWEKDNNREEVEDGSKKKVEAILRMEMAVGGHSNATERIDDIDEQEKKSSFTGRLGELKNPHQGESQKLQQTPKGGKKLEIDETPRISIVPSKRWRMLARNRFLKKNVNSEIGVEIMRSRRFSKEYKEIVGSREEGAVSDKEKAETEVKERGLLKEMDKQEARKMKGEKI
ncbi:hypothetical protein DITRI_Ditri08aG0064700 [Diplodiscus trichospermus]